MSQVVVDNPSHHRYELAVDGEIAFVTYRREPGVITFIHTVVPPALGGRGLAFILARAVLDAARAHGEKVIPQCPVVAAFIQKHPEYQDLVATSSP